MVRLMLANDTRTEAELAEKAYALCRGGQAEQTHQRAADWKC